jgi:hypothetical protein
MFNHRKAVVASIVIAVAWILAGMEYYAALERDQGRCIAHLHSTKGSEPISTVALTACLLSHRSWGPLESMLVWPGQVIRRLI